MTTYSTGCAKHITMRLDDFCLRKHLTKQLFHHRLQLRSNATTIEVNFIDIINLQLWKQFRVQNLQDSITALVKGVESLGIYGGWFTVVS